MRLDRVTITGADDSVDVDALVDLSIDFPFVEWGILLSEKRTGGPRFPSETWIADLMNLDCADELVLSGHLCGKWVRDLVLGERTFQTWIEGRGWPRGFDRVQLNFHAQRHAWDAPKLVLALHAIALGPPDEVILQFDGVNHDMLSDVKAAASVNSTLSVVPLFDLSGGAGVLPEAWPAPCAHYCGYAGGLSPDNLEAQLELIEKAAGPDQRVWIDVETHVRSEDDRVFDLRKVERFLEIAAPHIRCVEYEDTGCEAPE